MRLADRIALVKARLASPSPFLDPLASSPPESKRLDTHSAPGDGPSTLRRNERSSASEPQNGGLCIFCVRSRRRGGTRFGSSWDARHAASNFAKSLAAGSCSFDALQAAYDELGAGDIVFKVVERVGMEGRRLAAHEMESLLARRIAAHTRRHRRFICHKMAGVYSKQQLDRGWRTWRGAAVEARTLERRVAAERIGSFARGLWARRFRLRNERVRSERRAALTIQRAWHNRCVNARFRMARLNVTLWIAATLMQSALRGHLARRRIRGNACAAAAVAIQTELRRFRTERHYDETRRRVVLAQAHLRGQRGRAVALQRQWARSCRTLQALLRQHQAVQHLGAQRGAACALQRAHRGSRNRREKRAARRERKREAKAARAIQSRFRCRRAQLSYTERIQVERAERATRERAALTLQARARGTLGRRRVAEGIEAAAENAAAWTLQRSWHHSQAVKAAAKEDAAALKMQSRYRTHVARGAFEVKRSDAREQAHREAVAQDGAARMLQARVRGAQGKRRFAERKQGAAHGAARAAAYAATAAAHAAETLAAIAARAADDAGTDREIAELAAMRLQAKYRGHAGRTAYVLKRSGLRKRKKRAEVHSVVSAGSACAAAAAASAGALACAASAACAASVAVAAARTVAAALGAESEQRGATALQSRFRAHRDRAAFLARKAAIDQARRENDAALRIQSRYRCRNGKLAYQMKRQFVRFARDEAAACAVGAAARAATVASDITALVQARLENDAALRIQSRYRCRHGQMAYHMKRQAQRDAIALQSRRRDAALRIQSRYRCRHGQMAYHLKRQAARHAAAERQQDSATQIQARCRGWMGRRRAVAAAVASSGSAIDGWTTCWDDEAQANFFYNTLTEESVWERPAALLDATTTPASVQLSSAAAAWLPEGWTEVWDDDAQSTYYNHAETGEAVWKANLWSEEWEEDAEVPYYRNGVTGETAWELPSLDEQQQSGGGEYATSWIESWDNDAQAPYFTHATTGDVVWELPEGEFAMSPQADMSAETAEIADSENSYALVPAGIRSYHDVSTAANVVDEDAAAWHDAAVWDESGAAAGEQGWDVESALVPYDDASATATGSSGWVEEWDEDAQTLYYRNEVTGDTSWECPAEFGGVGAPEAEAHAWIELYDEDTEAPYWMHSETGETTWEQPAAAAYTYDGGEHVALASLEDGGAEDGGGEWEDVGAWLEEWDEETQAAYWCNESTGDTTWVDPYAGGFFAGEEEVAEEAPPAMCASCGEELTPLANFCRLCGTPCISIQDGFWEAAEEEGYLQNAATGEEAAWS